MMPGSGRRTIARLCFALLASACTPKGKNAPHDPVAPVDAPAAVAPERSAALDGPPPSWAGQASHEACRIDHVASLSLIPAQATAVMGVDALSVVSTRTWMDNQSLFDAVELKSALELAQGCDLGVTTWRGLTFGAELSGSQSATVIRVDGVGRPERLECMRAALERKQGKSPWTVASSGELAFDDGRVGFALDACTVVLASAGWAPAVRDRLASKGGSAADGPLGPLVARLDLRKPAWSAGVLPSSATTSGPFEGAKEFTATLSIVGGLDVALSLTFADPAQASKRAADLQQQFDGLKNSAVALGLPQRTVDSVRIVPAGAQVLLHVAATDDDLATLRRKAAGSTTAP